MSKKIVIIGATSAIAQALGRQFADDQNELFLIARNEAHVKTIAADLAIRSGKPCQFTTFNAENNDGIENCLSSALTALSQIDIAIVAHGTLADQTACQQNVQKALTEFQVNATSYIGLLTVFGYYFEKQKSGSIVVLSSCAGDRGRKSNYLYGAAKAAVSAFSAGLRAHLHASHVHVLTVKPGFVDTPMTQHFKKGFLWAKPDEVAKDMIKAMHSKKAILYTPWFWKYMMLIIKWLPEGMMRQW